MRTLDYLARRSRYSSVARTINLASVYDPLAESAGLVAAEDVSKVVASVNTDSRLNLNLLAILATQGWQLQQAQAS